MNFSLQILLETILIVLEVVPKTLLLALLILAIGIILGAIIALIKRNQTPVLTQIVNLFVSYMRGVPLIIHLFIIRYSLPEATTGFLSIFGVTMDPNEFPTILMAITAFSLLQVAFESENIRSAFQSVPDSQVEAGMSIGYTRSQNMRRVIIPQALTIAVPLFLNSYIKVIKSLSLAFTVGVVEIFAQARFAAALSYRYLESYVAAAVVYWIVCGILQIVVNKIQGRLSVNETA